MEITVRIDGVDRRAHAQILNGTLWVHYGGRCFTVETGSSARSRKRAGIGGASNEILAPMPGKITKILVEPGAAIASGASVLVMEAMKMEYSLKAEISGSIELIDCKVGDQVPLGKVLVKINPTEIKN